MKLSISKTINYRNFGFLPRKSKLYNLYAYFFGNPNLYKRLQAKDIIEALDLQPTDTVLDFGCGTGFFTVEMAKAAKLTYGIDINPLVSTLLVPDSLDGKLQFQQADGRALPFGDASFDKILASEVIAFIQDEQEFFKEFQRVLKPEGCLIVCNSAGHPVVRDAYENDGRYLGFLRKIFRSRVPKSYEAYCSTINAYFGNETSAFLQLDEMTAIAKTNDFDVAAVKNTPRNGYGAYLSWFQFTGFVLRGKPILRFGFIGHYLLFSLFGIVGKKGYSGGLLLTLKKKDV